MTSMPPRLCWGLQSDGVMGPWDQDAMDNMWENHGNMWENHGKMDMEMEMDGKHVKHHEKT